MTWQFFVGTLDKEHQSFRNTLFALACDPDKLLTKKDGKFLTMMDGLENMSSSQNEEMMTVVERLKQTRDGIIIGRDHLKNLAATVGDIRNPVGQKITLSGIADWSGLDLDFTIVGLFPPGRYDNFTAFNREYFQAAFDGYKVAHSGQKHPLDDVSLSLVWLKLPDRESYQRIVEQIGAFDVEPGREGGNGLVGDRHVHGGLSNVAGRNALVPGASMHHRASAGAGQRYQHQRPRAADGGWR